MQKRVSVVIPTYKRTGQKLINALQSVFNQSYKNIEIIVVDDNVNLEFSNDILRTISNYPEVIYLAHGNNKGACAARNTGILNASGEYIAFLDDDDAWANNKIEMQMEKFKNPRVGLVYCGIKYYYEKNKKTIYKHAVKSNNPCKDLLINNYIGSTSCGIVKKSCAIDVGMFDVNLKSGQDLDFWYRLAEKYEIDCVEDCLLYYTVYTEQTITSNYQNRLESNIYLKEKYADKINSNIELQTVYNLKILKSYLKVKRIHDAIKHIKNAVAKNELSIKYSLKYMKKLR